MDMINILDRQTATTQRFEYDFAVDGGVVGTVTLRGGSIPADAVITGSTTNQTAAFTSAAGTATVKLTLQSDGDLQGGPIDVATYSGTILSTSPAGASGANGVLVTSGFTNGIPAVISTTQERYVVLTVGVQNLTAGTFTLWLTYLQ